MSAVANGDVDVMAAPALVSVSRLRDGVLYTAPLFTASYAVLAKAPEYELFKLDDSLFFSLFPPSIF